MVPRVAIEVCESGELLRALMDQWMRTKGRKRGDSDIATERVASASEVSSEEGGSLSAQGEKRHPANLAFALSDIALPSRFCTRLVSKSQRLTASHRVQ